MNLLKKQPTLMGSLQGHLSVGQTLEKLIILEQKVDNIDIVLPQSINLEKNTSMEEFPVSNKKMTLEDKFGPLRLDGRNILLLPILPVESIFHEKVYSPFWNKLSREMSTKLWLPTEIGLQDLGLNYLNGCSENMEPRSWCKMTVQKTTPVISLKILCQSLLYSQQNIMEEGSIMKRTRKILFIPNKKTKNLLMKCFGATRYTYNKAIEYTVKNGCPTFYTLRNKIVPKNSELPENEKWLSEVPYDTRQNVLKEVVSMYKGCKTRKDHNWKPSFKSKKTPIQSCHVDSGALKTGIRLFVNRLKNSATLRIPNKKDRTWLNERIGKLNDFVIIMDIGRFYLCINTESNSIINNRTTDEVALDPGVRTFQTFYSPNGSCGKLGDGMMNKLKKIYTRIDKLSSIPRAKKRLQVLRTKVRNVVSNLHHQSSSFLCKNYRTIFIPEFKTTQMVGKNLPKVVKRAMMSLSHYKFRERLIHKAKLNGVSVIVCNESYTSKTCGKCGILNNIGKNKVFTCHSCGISIDRDLNGARNIYIRNYS